MSKARGAPAAHRPRPGQQGTQPQMCLAVCPGLGHLTIVQDAIRVRVHTHSLHSTPPTPQEVALAPGALIHATKRHPGVFFFFF